MTPLEPTEEQVNDLKKMVGIGAERLTDALAAIRSLDLPPISASKLRLVVDGVLRDKEASTAVVRQFIALASYQLAYSLEAEQVVERLFEGVRLITDDVSPHESFASIREFLVAGLKIEAFRYSAKALHLSFEHENMLSSARLISDLRPVFDDGRTKIVGGIVLFTLKLYYYSGDERKQISIAVDQDDLQKLISQAQRATGKAEALRSLIKANNDLDAFVAGEETYGFSNDQE